jgi:hypothetical protein
MGSGRFDRARGFGTFRCTREHPVLGDSSRRNALISLPIMVISSVYTSHSRAGFTKTFQAVGTGLLGVASSLNFSLKLKAMCPRDPVQSFEIR